MKKKLSGRKRKVIVIACIAGAVILSALGYILWFRDRYCLNITKVWVDNVRENSVNFRLYAKNGIEGTYRFEYGEVGKDFRFSTSETKMSDTRGTGWPKLSIYYPFVSGIEKGKTYQYRFVYDNGKCPVTTKTKTFVAGGDVVQE